MIRKSALKNRPHRNRPRPISVLLPPPPSPSPSQLGSLSARFESNGRPGAIGNDKNGGYSYGAYQIATRTGTFASYLTYLAGHYPALSAKLVAAGGAQAAASGSQGFRDAWTSLAVDLDSAFLDSQHGFIELTHYTPFKTSLINRLQFDVDQRSATMRDMAWSTAVQHGAANRIFDNAFRGQTLPALKDTTIIDGVYAERSKVNQYFPTSTPQVKAALMARFKEERAMAQKMLSAGGDAW